MSTDSMNVDAHCWPASGPFAFGAPTHHSLSIASPISPTTFSHYPSLPSTSLPLSRTPSAQQASSSHHRRPLRERVDNQLCIQTVPSLMSPPRRHGVFLPEGSGALPISSSEQDGCEHARKARVETEPFWTCPEEQSFSQLGPDAFIGFMQPGCPPPTMMWTDKTWGQWETREFTHTVCVMTQEEASRLHDYTRYAPVREMTMDGTRQLWLILPHERNEEKGQSSSESEMQLTHYQLYAALEFLAGALPSPPAGDSASAENGKSCVLIASTPGHQIDTAALGVCFLASKMGQSAYKVSQRLDEDPKVLDEWKGLLSWQDVEFVETVARCD